MGMELEYLVRNLKSEIERIIDDPRLKEHHKIVMKKFYRHLLVNHLNLHTIKSYIASLHDFALLIGDKQFKDVKKNDVENFILSLSHLSETSINLKKSKLKSFYKWYLGKNKYYPKFIKWMKIKRIDKSRVEIGDILTRKEIKILVNQAKNIKQKAEILMLYESAARRDEFIKLKIKDIVIDKYGAVITLNGKTGKRTIRLVESVGLLQMWLNVHPQHDDPNAPLFPTYNNNHPSEDYYSKLIKRLVEKSGIQKNVYPHLLRHSRLTELAKFLTEPELRLFAGWNKNSKMPAIYVHLAGRDIEPKILQYYGIKEPETPQLNEKPHVCPRCQTLNQYDAKYCFKCGLILDEREALKMSDSKVKEMLYDLLKKIIREELGKNPDKKEIVIKFTVEG